MSNISETLEKELEDLEKLKKKLKLEWEIEYNNWQNRDKIHSRFEILDI